MFPGIEVSRSTLQCKFLSFGAKSVYPSVNLPEVKVLDHVRHGAWAVWEQGVYFVNPEARPHQSVEFYSFATDRTTQVAMIEKEPLWNGPNLTTTSDGRWILYVQVDQTESDIILVENFS